MSTQKDKMKVVECGLIRLIGLIKQFGNEIYEASISENAFWDKSDLGKQILAIIKNGIYPEFKIGDEVWYLIEREKWIVRSRFICSIEIKVEKLMTETIYWLQSENSIFDVMKALPSHIYPTKDLAQAACDERNKEE